MLNFRSQVKFPRYNEIVSLTLPDGSERSGQVLEARGMCFTFKIHPFVADASISPGNRAVVQVRCRKCSAHIAQLSTTHRFSKAHQA